MGTKFGILSERCRFIIVFLCILVEYWIWAAPAYRGGNCGWDAKGSRSHRFLDSYTSIFSLQYESCWIINAHVSCKRIKFSMSNVCTLCDNCDRPLKDRLHSKT